MSETASSRDPSAAAAAQQTMLRQLPAVDEVLDTETARGAATHHGRGAYTHHVRAALQRLRQKILAGQPPGAAALTAEAVAAAALGLAATEGTPLPRVLNGTGVIMHSGLGRAPLPQAAVEALQRAGTYSLLEVDRAEGRRRSRDARCGELLQTLTGAEASLVVNNNAAATLLILRSLAAGREVICSRGEMVEIGGSYRIPDVMAASGCRLVEVGTTNRTHIADYERAITEDTAALLVVHTSNYRVIGFTCAPRLEEVVALGRERGIPVVHDLGSGSLLGPEQLGLGDEPPVTHSLRSGADVVCMSGDKLLGGPQAGIILGRGDLVALMRRNSLARALRIDKMAVAALEATLRLYFDPAALRERHPVIRMLTTPPAILRERAAVLVEHLLARAPAGTEATVAEVYSETGSGALPTLQIASAGAVITHPEVTADDLARALRHADPGVFSRISDDRLCLDLRTLFPGEETEAAEVVATTLHEILEPCEPPSTSA